jgi:hypothetical protein
MRKLLWMVPLLLAAGTALAGALVAFTGSEAWPESAGWVWHPCNDENYMESWQFIVHADNGGFLYVTFVVSNAGLGDFNPGIGAAYFPPDGPAVSNDIKLNRHVLHASDQTLDISIADMRLWKHGGVIRCVIPRGQVLVDMSLTPTVAPWREGTGHIVLGNPRDSWNWMVNAPRGRATGKVTVGGKTYDVAGYGYLDHAWSNKAFFDFSKRWITLRYFSPKGSLVLFHLLVSNRLGAESVNNLSLSNNDQPIRSTPNPQLDFTNWIQATDYRIPTTITAHGRVGATDVSVEATNGQLAETSDPLRSLPEIERQVIRLLVAKPMVFRVLMDIKVTRTENGVSDVEHGRGIASMLFFDQ